MRLGAGRLRHLCLTWWFLNALGSVIRDLEGLGILTFGSRESC